MQQVRLTLPMIPNMELTASKTACAMGEQIGLSADKIDEVQMAVVEACINAFEHSDAADREVHVLLEVLGVSDEGGSLRVNVWFQNPPSGRSEVRIQTLNTLYDVQSIVGQQLSASVWIYRAPAAERAALQGLAFFRALTGQTVFKHADELP